MDHDHLIYFNNMVSFFKVPQQRVRKVHTSKYRMIFGEKTLQRDQAGEIKRRNSHHLNTDNV